MVTVTDRNGAHLKVALPQTGSSTALQKGDAVLTRWHPTQAQCFAMAQD